MLDINETTLVQVTNNGEDDITLTYASRPYILTPGKKTGLPYYAAALWFGNPVAVDRGGPEDRHLKDRAEEIDRLSLLYGLCGAPWTTTHAHTQTDLTDDRIRHKYEKREDGKYWHPNLPNVEVTDMEGETLPMVVTDPEGDDVTPAQASSRSEQKATQEAIQALQQQLRTLQLQLGREQSGEGEQEKPTPRGIDPRSPEGRNMAKARGEDVEDGAHGLEKAEDGPTVRPEAEPERGASGPSVDRPPVVPAVRARSTSPHPLSPPPMSRARTQLLADTVEELVGFYGELAVVLEVEMRARVSAINEARDWGMSGVATDNHVQVTVIDAAVETVKLRQDIKAAECRRDHLYFAIEHGLEG